MMTSQMQELVRRVHATLTEPWNKKIGRPRSSGLYEAVEIACMYLRQNGTQEFLGDLKDISQPTVSRIVTTLVPIVKAVLEEFVPDAKEAIELVQGRVCLRPPGVGHKRGRYAVALSRLDFPGLRSVWRPAQRWSSRAGTICTALTGAMRWGESVRGLPCRLVAAR